MDTQKVAGVFLTQHEASEAIEELKRYGYDANDISVISKDHEDAEALSEKTGTKAPEGAAGGATAGGILGGVGGLLAGLGALAIPGIGPLLAAGPIATALAGIAVGATGGGLVGGLIGLGIPEQEAKSYEEHIGGGRMLILVDTSSDRKLEVEDIFRRHYALNHTRLGAEHDTDNLTVEAPHQAEPHDSAPHDSERRSGVTAEEAAAAYRATGNDQASLQRENNPETDTASTRDAIQLRAEQLDVSKKQVRTGEVEVRKEIVHEEKVIRVPVSREEIVIERRAVDGNSTDERIGRDETIRIPVSEERIEVNKHSVVTGEVDIYKREVEEMQHIEGTVKHEEARVERTGHAPVNESTTSGSDRTAANKTADSLPLESSPALSDDDMPVLPPRSERPRR